MRTLRQQVDALKHQLEWFKRQVFGSKSERYAPQPDPSQLYLGEVLPTPDQSPELRKNVPAHTRRVPRRDPASETAEALPFFDESCVPMQTITVANPEIEGLSADQYEVIDDTVLLTVRETLRPAMKNKIRHLCVQEIIEWE